MKILLLPAYFTPELVSDTPLDNARYKAFAEAGFDMSLITSVPTRGVNENDKALYKNRKKERMYDDKMIVQRFSMVDEGSNPLGRAFRYFLCFVKQYYLGRKQNNTDIIFVVSTPPIQGMLAALLKKKLKCKFVYNLQDIFPDTLVGAGMAKKGGFLWRVGRMIEDYTYKNADKIIVISEDFKRNIIRKGVPEDKIEIVRNWVDEETIHPIKRLDNPLFEEFGVSRDKFNIVYAGNLGNAQNLNIIVDAAKILRKNSNIQFIVFGSGGLENELRSEILRESLNNVRLFPLQPYERVSFVYGMGNICLVSCKAGLGGSALPSKTWSILSAGRAVIASFDEGELKNILEYNRIGVFTHAGDVNEFVNSILSLSANPLYCEEMGMRGREYILSNLTKEVGTSKYIEIIKDVCK